MAVNDEKPIATKTVTVKYTEWGEYHYFASFCLSFGYRERPTLTADVKVTRIWADGELIFSDVAGVQTYTPGLKFSVRRGTSDQMPVGGAELAYRDQLLIWFHDYDLGTNGSLPAFTAEFTDDTGATLMDALEAFAIRAGFAEEDIDVDPALDYPIVGYIADGQASLNSINTNLGFIYNFSGVEVAGRIIFKQNYDDEGNTVAQWTIPQESLAVISESSSDQQVDVIEIASDQGLPRSITATYYDVDFNFDQNSQTAQRNLGTSGSETDVEVTLPIVAAGPEIRAFITDALYRSWDQRNGHSLRLPRSFIGADPGDVIQWTVDGETFTAELQRVTINGDFSVSVSAAEIAVTFDPIVTTATQPPATPVPTIIADEVNAVVFDIPDWLTNQTQPNVLNLRVAMGGYLPGKWKGARFDMTRSDQPNGWAPRLQLGQAEEIGIAVLTAKPTNYTGAPGSLDPTTILTVNLRNMPVARLLAGEIIAVGKDGRFELMKFTTVTVIDPTTVQLSGLTRGLFGTEDFVNQHAAGDHLAFVNDLRTITYSVDDYTNNRTFFYRGVTPLMAITDAQVKYFKPQGNSRRPYSPNNVTALRMMNGDLTFTWQKHNRFTGEPDSVWSVDIFNEDWTVLLQRINNIVIGDITATDIEWTYFVDYQFTNGINELTTVNALVYQMNASHGVRGFPGGGAVTPRAEGIFSANGLIELIASADMGQDIFLDALGVLALNRDKAVLTAGVPVIELAAAGVLAMSADADLLVGGLSAAGVLELNANANLLTSSDAPLLKDFVLGVQTTSPLPGTPKQRYLVVDAPVDLAVGDLLVFFGSLYAADATNDAVWASRAVDTIHRSGDPADAGFNYLVQAKQGTAGHYVLAWKIAEERDIGWSWYWGNFALNTGYWRGGMTRYQNFHPLNPLLASGAQGSNTDTTLFTAPSIASKINALLYNIVFPRVASYTSRYNGIGPQKPSDMSWVEYVPFSSTAPRYDLMLAATKLLSASGVTGSKTYTPPQQMDTLGPKPSPYEALSYVVNPQPILLANGKLELAASADLVVPTPVLLEADVLLDMAADADLYLAPADPYEVLASYDISTATATIDVPISAYTADYGTLIFEVMRFKPVSDGVDLMLRESANGGSSYDAGATDYALGQVRHASGLVVITPPASTGNTGLPITAGNGIGNDAHGGVTARITVAGFASGHSTRYRYDIDHYTNDDRIARYSGAGMRKTAQATTHIRVMFSSGNIASGKLRVIGIKK